MTFYLEIAVSHPKKLAGIGGTFCPLGPLTHGLLCKQKNQQMPRAQMSEAHQALVSDQMALGALPEDRQAEQGAREGL